MNGVKNVSYVDLGQQTPSGLHRSSSKCSGLTMVLASIQLAVAPFLLYYQSSFCITG